MPKVTTVGQYRQMTLTHRRRASRHRKVRQLNTAYRISSKTVLRRLRTDPAPIRQMRPYVGQVLNIANCHRRLLWARRHPHLTHAQWTREMFIKHIWTLVVLNVRINHEINNVRDLRAALIHEWKAIPNVVIRRNTRSMRRLLH